MDEFMVVEGVSGLWHYHLARAGESPAKALCGARTMATQIPVSTWGYRSPHLPESYCNECCLASGLWPHVAEKSEETTNG